MESICCVFLSKGRPVLSGVETITRIHEYERREDPKATESNILRLVLCL